jgi:hypothetical protein
MKIINFTAGKPNPEMKYSRFAISIAKRGILTIIVPLFILFKIYPQSDFTPPPRRIVNLLDTEGPYVKTIYSFKPAGYDTLKQPGQEPFLVPKYNNDNLIPIIFDAVLSKRIKVYDPNFWGTIPQFIQKGVYDEFDTTRILDYLDAGWDTSLMINQKGEMDQIIEYRNIPYDELSGLFFFESWKLDDKRGKLYKDVLAYFPIREYATSVYDGYENTEIRRRLLFMINPRWSYGKEKRIRLKPREFMPVQQSIQYEVKLYNKSYHLYLYRENDFGRITDSEYNQWQYHTFDFYRHFDPDLFLEKIISGVLEGTFRAYPPGDTEKTLKLDEFIRLLGPQKEWIGITDNEDTVKIEPRLHSSELVLFPEDYPLSELNSITFHENWYINPENLMIYKDVNGITIHRTEEVYDQYTGDFIRETEKPLFTIWF